jgi:YD repeat-containing protein
MICSSCQIQQGLLLYQGRVQELRDVSKKQAIGRTSWLVDGNPCIGSISSCLILPPVVFTYYVTPGEPVMPDPNQLEALENKSPEKTDGVSDGVKNEVLAGREDLSTETKDYYQARKGGMRDKDTAEHFGAQPEFFDSSAVTDASYIGKDGEVHAGQDDDGSIVTYDESDGSVSRTNPDQSQVVYDKDGRLTSCTHPDGNTAKMEYDKDGNLNKVKLPDESSWDKNQDGTWDRKDKDGKTLDHVDTIAASKDGDVMLQDEKTGETRVSHLDGSRTLINGDNSQMTTDADGHVTSVTHPDGKTATVEYGDDGQAKKLNLPDGGHWEKKGESNWQRTDKDGKVLDDLDGTISVSKDGAIVLDDQKSGESQISHLDGSRETIK